MTSTQPADNVNIKPLNLKTPVVWSLGDGLLVTGITNPEIPIRAWTARELPKSMAPYPPGTLLSEEESKRVFDESGEGEARLIITFKDRAAVDRVIAQLQKLASYFDTPAQT